MSCHLSKALRKELGRRALPVHKNDTTKVMTGAHKGFSGKVSRVDRESGTVFIEKLVRRKADGTEIPLSVRTHKIMLVELDSKDERRLKRKKRASRGTAEEKGSGKKEEGIRHGK